MKAEDLSTHDRRQQKRENRRQHYQLVSRRQKHRQHLIHVGGGVLVALLIVAGYLAFAGGEGASTVRRPAPTWQATSIDGELVSSQGLEGDVYAVDFFFTWCQICKAQLPHKKALVERFKDEPDFHFISVSADPSDSRAGLDGYRTSHGANWPFAQDRDGLYQKFGVDSRPFIVFVNRAGEVVKTIRTLTDGEKLIRIVEPLLVEPVNTTASLKTSSATPEPSSNTTTPYMSWATDSRRR